MDRNLVYTISLVLVIIGALNWGLVGLFNFDLVAAIFGLSIFARVIYILVGVAAVLVAIYVFGSRKLTKQS